MPTAASLQLKLYAAYGVWGIGMAGRRWQNACIEIRRFSAKAKLSESNLLIEPLLGLAEFLASRHRMCNWALRFRIEFRPFSFVSLMGRAGLQASVFALPCLSFPSRLQPATTADVEYPFQDRL